jgi:hypothetical protein
MTRAKRKPKPKSNPTHWSLKPAGDKLNKGTYYRRLEDIEKGLREIDKSKLPSGGRFMFLYYGCEKLAKGIVGIHAQWEAEEAYNQSLELAGLKAAASAMKLGIPDAELDALFLSNDKTTARYWRNEIAHNFGPSNVGNIVKHSAALNKRMHDLLDAYTPAVLAYLRANYSHLLP